MKLWPWGLLLIGLIGTAAAAPVIIIVLTQSGSVTVVTPGLVWTGTLTFGSITQSLTDPVTASQAFTLRNSGTISLTISYSCTCPTGLSIILGSPDIQASVLGAGATDTGTATLTIQPTAASGPLAFTVTINGGA